MNTNIHQQLWEAFSDIEFEEKRHRYTDSKNTFYRSATGWIHQFSPPKDWDAIRMKSAIGKIKREKNDFDYKPTPEEIAAKSAELKVQWDRAGDYACNLGTQVHSVMENLWYKKNYDFDERLDETYPEMREDFEFRKARCKELFKRMKHIYAPVENEFIVYDQPNGICGTIDFLAYNMKTGKYAIIDWKTSKSFDTHNLYGEYMAAPFSDLEACNTTEYSLQLSLYKSLLCNKINIPVDELLLFQIPGKDVAMPQVHRCFDLSDRIASLLEKK